MIEVFDCEQNSEAWQRARLGIPTASEFKSVLAKGEGKTRRTYMMKLLGERFTGEPADNFTNSHMERGHALEDEARKLFSLVHDTDLTPVGFVRNGEVGCSPDSLIETNGILEIKTKLPHLQLEAIFADKLPSEHQAQVQGQLWVAEREYVQFVSYWPRLPLFVKKIYRDDAYISNLAAEVQRFLVELNELTEKLTNRGASRAAA